MPDLLGLTADELQAEIERRMAALDSAQDDAENLGPFADLMRTMALIAFQRAAELILLNNERLAEQLEWREDEVLSAEC